MSPISEFPAAAANSLLGVCFDIDDTVTSHGALDVAAYAALGALRASGLKLIAVTGRPLGFAEIVARTWLVDAAVGENGAGHIARSGKGLSFGFWDDAPTRAAQQITLAKIRARVARELSEVRETDDSWARRCDLAFDVNERVTLPRAVVDRLTSIIESEGAQALVSSVHAHAQLGQHDKASGACRALTELYGFAADEVRQRFLFVGDSGNDAAAFAWFEWTAGVANVARFLDRLPRAPRYTATREYGEGFAEIARTILALRGSGA
jgi:HAD superfamily hydrolase (TIGR01484 family)